MINSKINKIKNLTNKKNNSHKKTFSSTSTVTATTSYGNKPKDNKSNNNLEKCSSKKNSSYITVNNNSRKKNISSNFVSNTSNSKSKLNNNINNTNIIYSPKTNNIPREKISNNNKNNNSIKNINKVDHFSVSPKKYYDFNKMIKNFSHYKSSSNIQSNNISNNKKRKPSNPILPFKKESNIKGITIKGFEEIILKNNNLNYNKNIGVSSSERNKQISKSKTNRNIYNKNYIEYFKKRNKY
jgi:hypothetical protein